MGNIVDRLRLIEAKNAGMRKANRTLNVYYGWSRLNKIQKREGIAVFFENEAGAGSETSRSHKTLKRLLDVVAVRPQSEKEKEDASLSNRVFSVYYIFLDEKAVNGSLEKALELNSQSDRNNVPEKVRKEIADKLRTRYLETHPGYKEPGYQYEIQFPE